MKHRTWIFFAFGAVTMLLLQLHFVLFWKSYYIHFPIQGYEGAMAEGKVAPFFTGSTQSAEITKIVLFLLPLAVLWFARGSAWRSTCGLWLGVMFSVVIIWLATERLRRDSNMWPIDLVLLSVMTGVPLFLGCITQVVIQRILSYFLKRL
jgi:uncharacterized membrane protein